jgi:GNAT superfamily N-acetyltransferase
MADIREADLPEDQAAVERLWLEYLTWADEEVAVRYGWRASARDEADHELATIARFQPPDGRLLVAFLGDLAIGTVCMQRIGQDTAELKHMYVQPSHRQARVGRALVDRLLTLTRTAGYERVRLDSPKFMSAAHGLYRSMGFTEIEPYPENEIPADYHPDWVFMERTLT